MRGPPWLYGRNWSRIGDPSAHRDERPLSVTKKTARIRMKTVIAEENGPAVCPVIVSGFFPLPTNALLCILLIVLAYIRPSGITEQRKILFQTYTQILQ